MKRSIHLVLSLMTICTAGLLGFQLYWNYQAYQSATRGFRQDTSAALETAVRQEQAQRRQGLVRQYQTWLADTSQVVIGCHVHPLYQTTVFTLADKYPSAIEESQPFDVSFDDFPQKLPSITPQARKFFIRRFATGTIARQLREGFVIYHTQRLGDRLSKASKQSRTNQKQLRILYAAALKERDIAANFRLTVGKKPPKALSAAGYGTRAFKTGIMGQPELVKAWFPDPNLVFLDRMKWVLGSSLLLMLVVLGCFGFTVRTLLRQRKLAELKDDFVNNMTHELKTPVATIRLAADALQTFALSPAATADYLTIVRQQAGRLTGLIDQILRSVVLEQAPAALARQPVEVSRLIGQVLRQNAPQLAQARLSYHPPAAPVYVLGDETHLANVLATLLDNALKYSLNEPRITIRYFAQEGTASLEVSDNGPGIPAAYQARVFDRFFRVPTGNLHAVKGYGLGLSYTKTIVEGLGGRISLRSAAGRGTTFTITLPLAQHEPAPPTPA
ncbi:histidine kinase [Hymenobacter roseosalivarius DSM 11622]|uniref:histidine kinase n=1 Tax=Hymenobacter roseosalivarius DSM 11622 TaxID=645990 RepID=A0A1W1VCG9_9BACT|nr:HAMP domain-containing sensor histidine kinase [Hymenobacter roseosalivarius]SMB91068.1 histidine kinase [Hymenobacter roseosalivarius DSM 11622]